ncbi:hypothetical protein BKA60DRAFT_136366 [Fusarium oxysporum]|nr:hypothetical protein BKA60DRAFT_136366 [Fusarium oxysporum]
MMMGTKSLRACSLLSAMGMDPCYVGFLVLTRYFGVAFSGYSMSMKDENLLGDGVCGSSRYQWGSCLFLFFVYGLFSLLNITSPHFESSFLFLFLSCGNRLERYHNISYFAFLFPFLFRFLFPTSVVTLKFECQISHSFILHFVYCFPSHVMSWVSWSFTVSILKRMDI